jgi:hypothetical protein
MPKHIKWVEVEVTGAGEASDGNCTTYSGTETSGEVLITSVTGKQHKVDLRKGRATVTVCNNSQVATVHDNK